MAGEAGRPSEESASSPVGDPCRRNGLKQTTLLSNYSAEHDKDECKCLNFGRRSNEGEGGSW